MALMVAEIWQRKLNEKVIHRVINSVIHRMWTTKYGKKGCIYGRKG